MKYPLIHAGVLKAISSTEEHIKKNYPIHVAGRGKYLQLLERLHQAEEMLCWDTAKDMLDGVGARRLVAWVTVLHFNPKKEHAQLGELIQELEMLGFSEVSLRVSDLGYNNPLGDGELNEQDYWPC